MYTYKVLLHKEVEGGYTVTVPVLPGCITYGDNVDECIAMAREAIELYIEVLQERGETIPDDFRVHKMATLEKDMVETIMGQIDEIHIGIKITSNGISSNFSREPQCFMRQLHIDIHLHTK